MLKRLNESIAHHFIYCLGGYFLLQIGVRLITTSGVVIDESEQVMLTQYLALGYNAQPPLYTWLQIIFFGVFGRTVFAIALLKNLVLFSIYVFTYLTARRLMKDSVKAACSTLGLIFLPQLAWEAQVDQIHTVLLTASTAALMYYYFKAWERPRYREYVFMGVAAASGLLAKYNFIIVLAALFGATLLVADFRKRLLNIKVLLTMVILIGGVLPHGVWVLQNTNLATQETMHRMSAYAEGGYLTNVAKGTLDLVVANVTFVAVFMACYIGLFRKQFRVSLSPAVSLLLTYMCITILAVFAIILVTEATNIKERWLQPYLFIAPMVLFLMTDLEKADEKRRQTYISIAVVFCVMILLVIPLRVILVDFGSKPHRESYPFEHLAKDISQADMQTQLILAEDKFIGGNLKLFFPDATVITPSIPLQTYPPQEQVLVVWENKNPIAYLRDTVLLAHTEPLEFTLPFLYSEKFTATFFAQMYTMDRSTVK